MRTSKTALAFATVAAIALTPISLRPAAAESGAVTMKPAGGAANAGDEISARKRYRQRYYSHGRNDAGLRACGAIAGTVGGIIAAEQARRYYRRHYDPYYAQPYGAPYGYYGNYGYYDPYW